MKRHINRAKFGQAGSENKSQTSRQIEPQPLDSLPFPDFHYLSAAHGWLGLGDWKQAEMDLLGISTSAKDHFSVLETRYQIYAMAKNWPQALDVCQIIIKKAPERSLGWNFASLALNEMSRTKEAYELLFKVLYRFPKDSLMRYNMACYACKLGLLSEASIWLRRSFEVGDAFQLMSAALSDADLKPMWSKMGVEPAKK